MPPRVLASGPKPCGGNNAWSNKNFLYYLTFRMLQHTSSEVKGYNCYKHLKNLKNTKIKRGTGDKIKNNDLRLLRKSDCKPL